VIVTESSTAPRDTKPKHYATGGSSQTTGTLGMVPVSGAETVTIRFARPESFEDALKEESVDANRAAVVMTCRYSHQLGLLFQSPTVRLNAGAFELVDLLRTRVDWRSRCERTISLSELPATMIFQLTTIGAVTQAIKPLTGLVNSTDSALGIASIVESKVGDALALAQQEWFEDGTESEFAKTLSTLIHTYGDTAVAMVERFLASPSVNTEIAVEAAQSLGAIGHPGTYRYRKSLLEKLLLTSTSARLRHGAASGLAAMNDASSLAKVIQATERETNSRLRRFLELLVDQLQRTRACRSS
jgi:hypothetical protein